MINSNPQISNSYSTYPVSTVSQNSIPTQQTPQQLADSAPQKDNSIQSKFYSNSGLIMITIGGILLSLLAGGIDSWKAFKKP